MITYDFTAENLKNRPLLDDKYRIIGTIGEGRYAKYIP